MKKIDWKAVGNIGILLACVIVLCLLASCRSTKIVEVEKIQRDSIYVASATFDSTFWQAVKQYTDSVYEKDSTYTHDSVYVYQKGDTLTITKERLVYKDRWYEKVVEKVDTLKVDKLIEKHDTTYIERVDSIPYEVIVEKELTRWQKWKMKLGGWAMLAILAMLGYVGYKIYKRFM